MSIRSNYSIGNALNILGNVAEAIQSIPQMAAAAATKIKNIVANYLQPKPPFSSQSLVPPNISDTSVIPLQPAKTGPLAADIHKIFEMKEIGSLITAYTDEYAPEIMKADKNHAQKEISREMTIISYTQLCIACRDLNIELKDSLTYFPNLKELIIAHCINDSILFNILTKIEKCPKLDYVSLSNSNITDRGLTSLAQNCPQLTKINLFDCTKISDPGLIALAQNCPHLTDISLMGCENISDQGVIPLVQNSPQLIGMFLSETKITDLTIRTLAQHCPQLKFINLDGCENISEDAIRELAQHCTQLEVIIYPDGTKIENDEVENFRLLSALPQFED